EEEPALPPGPMRNWEIWVTPSGRYDAQAVSPGVLAFLVPYYLLHMHLWSAFALWVAVLIISIMLGWVLGTVVQVIVWLYFWRAAPTLLRQEFMARGFRLWRVMADPTQVETALINLAVNARDAMPDGGMLVMETKNVAIDGAYAATEPGLEPGDYVLLSVTDTGHGMSEDVRSLAIEPFFTTKDKGKGTGLGLSMVYGFAKQSRGHISIYSEANKGTTVNLYLPRHIGLDDEVSGSQTEVEGTARATGELILVVEDDERLRRLTVSRLEELGYRTVEAASGPEALAVLETTRGISLVFSDLVMPGGMSGYDLCTRARQRWPAMRLLLTSGYAEEAVEPGKLADAGVDLLRKPYRLPALADAIRKAIKGS
ncbi:MAG: ATP-binding protein, partial [Pseudomonadota bacterium]